MPLLSSLRATRRRLPALVAAVLCFASTAAFGAEVSKEYQVKAAFLYNFTKFIEWPASSFADAQAPLVIGVFCPKTLARELELMVQDRKVNGRAITVKELSEAAQARSTHLIFICGAEDDRYGWIDEAIGQGAVVTVGETASFAALGGMITFVLDGDKVRFEINVESAERSGLKVSAQLQKLARSVGGKR